MGAHAHQLEGLAARLHCISAASSRNGGISPSFDGCSGCFFDHVWEAKPLFCAQRASSHIERPLAQPGERDDSCHGYCHTVPEQTSIFRKQKKMRSMAKLPRVRGIPMLASEWVCMRTCARQRVQGLHAHLCMVQC